jgi:amino acid transporter
MKNSPKKSLGTFTLVLINLAAILSLRNLPLLAPYGLGMVPLYAAVAAMFFIPVALISAELASMIPEEGGIYAWLRPAFGERCAFLCTWMSFVTTITSLTMTLVFVSTSLAYALHSSLSHSHLFVCAVIVTLTWGATFVSLRGIRLSATVTAISSIVGTLIPGALLIGLCLCWVLGHQPSAIVLSTRTLLPNFNGLSSISLLAGVLFAFAGIEMSAFHVRDVENPRRTYPRAIFYSTVLILLVSVLGTLAIALTVPSTEIRLETGVMQALGTMLAWLHLSWLAPWLGFLIAFGGVAYIIAWIAGPSRGLLATSSNGPFPHFFRRTNGHGMPSTILICQAAIITLCALLFLLVPSIGLGFWILNAASSLMILILYFFLFLAGPVLRRKMPNAARPYRLPFGNGAMYCLSAVGLVAITFATILSFVLPDEMAGELSKTAFGTIVLSLVLLLGSPALLFRNRSKKNQNRSNSG